MNNLGTEVGQKMRCAVKAKLIELGSGGTAGYIDDELPDYVMIMVANKRSRQQMVEDLNLFLGSNTDVFVSWLHQVLDKLQEVTLPSQSGKAKRKSNDSGEVASKKDKKEKKKEKRLKRSAKDATAIDAQTHPPASSEPTDKQPEPLLPPSITDVFADNLIQKANKSIAMEKSLSIKAKKESMDPDQPPVIAESERVPTSNVEPAAPVEQPIEDADEFDIPTITEIAEGACELQRKKKELKELAEIQKKIYIAKSQLKSMCSDESEDEDFINLKANEDDIDTVEEEKKQQNRNRLEQEELKRRANRKPITYGNESLDGLEEDDDEGSFSPLTSPPRQMKKKSVLDRLGAKQAEQETKPTNTSANIISLSAHRKVERELYVPTFRRTKDYEAQQKQKQQEKDEAERARNSIRDRIRERQRDRESEKEQPHRGRDRNHRDRSRDKQQQADEPKSRDSRSARPKSNTESLPDSSTQEAPRTREKVSVRQRIGSRVFVMPPKPDEDVVIVPVNSVVKVTPRPNRPINKQACKNLLLRAVAEAQKSTSNIPIKAAKEMTKQKPIISKSAKSRLDLDPRTRQKNIIIEIPASGEECVVKRETPEFQIEFQNTSLEDGDVEEVEAVADTIDVDDSDEPEVEEYVPETVSAKSADENSDSGDYVYIPKTKGEVDYEEEAKKTQFVVTLDGMYGKKKVTPQPKVTVVVPEKKQRQKTPPLPPARKSIKDRIGYKTSRHDKANERRSRSPRRASLSPPPLNKYSSSSRRSPSKWSREKARDYNSSTRRRSRSRSPHKNDSPDTTTSTRDERDKESKTPDRSLTPPPPVRKPPPTVAPSSEAISFQRKVSPINFNLTDDEHHSSDGEHSSPHKLRSTKRDTNNMDLEDQYHEKLVKKLGSSGKFDNLPPLLSSVTIPAEKSTSGSKNLIKSIDRCIYYPTCRQGETCEFLHPTKPCKAFPNCKFGDKCSYIHPVCRFNKVCARPDCNFMHTMTSSVLGGSMITAAPPLASSVVPVQNYKSITTQPLPALCKYYPNCTNIGCVFYHPKMCKYGKNCPYKVECNFYHFDLPSANSFKWISPTV